MSLTSYRAAPPRVNRARIAGDPGKEGDGQNRGARDETPRWDCRRCKEADVVLGRSGNDLLSRVLRHSTIGAEAFNGRVRDGIGFLSPRSDHRTGQRQQQGCQGHHPEVLPSGPKHIGLSLTPALSGSQDPAKPERAPPIIRRKAKQTLRPRRPLEANFNKILSNGHRS